MVITNIEDLMDILLNTLTPEQIEEALNRASNRAEKEKKAKAEAEKARKAKAEEEARKAALKKERITAARNDVLNAYINYLKVIAPKQLTDAELETFKKQFSNELQYFETAFIRF